MHGEQEQGNSNNRQSGQQARYPQYAATTARGMNPWRNTNNNSPVRADGTEKGSSRTLQPHHGIEEDMDMAHFELIEKMAPNAVIKVVGVGGGGGGNAWYSTASCGAT